MKKLLSYILTPIYWLHFGTMLVLFHAIQLICQIIGGYPLRKKSVDILNFFLLYGLKIVGAKIKLKGFDNIPENQPLIIVSNHQSTFDIPPIIWALRKHHPKFVSKKELEKGIPSISYNLRMGNSALIDRTNGRQALIEIAKLGRHIEKENYSASIFPEGTRTKDGSVKFFRHAGIAALVKTAPSAIIIPIVIDGSYELIKDGYFPLAFGTKLTYTALPSINPKGRDIKELTQELEDMIKKELGVKN